MNPDVITAARAAYPTTQHCVTLGAIVHEGAAHAEPLVGIPLAMMNRHGLIAGATGTGKTKTLQLMAEQLSKAGVPVFLADVKGDVSGVAAAGETNGRIQLRTSETGYQWSGAGFPVEFLSLTGKLGAQLRATVSSFGPLLLAKVLGLNETQSSVLAMVFKYADDRNLLLLDFADLRAVLQYLSGEGAGELEEYGGMSKQTVGVLLREMVELEQQGAGAFFGEPEFDLGDLLQTTPDGRGVVSILELKDMQDRPALFSTFMMWMLARLYNTLPEAGDLEKPKLVFFLDEAHLLFEGASKAFKEQVEQVVRLIRSKGVGVWFVTQSPKDVPADILGQLGNRVQHALRAFTPDDEKALRAAARTFPKTKFYDVQETLQTLGIGEALVTVLAPNGAPTPPFAVRVVPPSSRMGPLTDVELQQHLASSVQVKEYAQSIDRESARELLAKQAEAAREAAMVPQLPRGVGFTVASEQSEADRDAGRRHFEAEKERLREARRPAKEPPSALAQALNSPIARTIAGTVARGLMGALLGGTRRRRR
ncbi:MAG TPA: helicase HerA-like domain-containing protein [Gemmatimonadaceae bacterium]|nr:helicase HerA-like domain-containing protein [Gemmatimonadaceae bacterium]